MKKTAILITVLVLVLPSLVFSDSLIFRLGYFMPKAPRDLVSNPDSLWAIEFDNMSFTIEDYRQAMYGFGYEKFLTKQLSFLMTVDFYGKDKLGVYNEWVGYEFAEGDFAFPAEYYFGEFSVVHAFNVSITPIQLSLKLTPLGRRARFVPYVGGGAGLYFWSVKLRGDLVDFSDPYIYDDPDLGEIDVYPILPTDARERGRLSVGYHAFGGIQIPVGYRLTLDAEVRYNFIKGTWKSDSAFEGFEAFDMSGPVIAAGISYWF